MATPTRQIRVPDVLWEAAKDAAARRNTTRAAYLVAKLVELVEADRAEQAFINGLEAPTVLEAATPTGRDWTDADTAARSAGRLAHLEDTLTPEEFAEVAGALPAIDGLAPHNTDDAAGDYVRAYYKVPAHIDGRIVLDGRPGVIAGFDGAYLVVVFDDNPTAARRAHPTWRVDYTVDAWNQAGTR